MSLISFKFLGAFSILLITLFAGWYPFKKRIAIKDHYELPIAEALTSGVFLGAALMHMLHNAAQHFSNNGYTYPFAFLITGSTFLLLLWLEHLGRELYEHRGQNSNVFAIIAIVILSVHSLLAGAALGLETNLSVGILMLVAIVAHKWLASFALAVHINKSNLSIRAGISWFVFFALMVPIGILFGSISVHLLHANNMLSPIFTSIAAGTFLYLGTLHGLERAVMIEKCCNLRHFSFVILGFSIMAVVAVWT